jgi:hypothetical protein
MVDNEESEMHVVEDLGMCQSIVDEIIFSLFKFLAYLKVLEKELEW